MPMLEFENAIDDCDNKETAQIRPNTRPIRGWCGWTKIQSIHSAGIRSAARFRGDFSRLAYAISSDIANVRTSECENLGSKFMLMFSRPGSSVRPRRPVGGSGLRSANKPLPPPAVSKNGARSEKAIPRTAKLPTLRFPGFFGLHGGGEFTHSRSGAFGAQFI
ncbi:hypothetical protein ZHAS_00022262 [Anopheles sinensis]|uniref:Uncharacterized protein n=1 Tax=Anopheles sinensis TaxID=74873 RepID=A0A084WUW4_ANOSI|nr:hypothetical protein ZHAS_00022262 [Anopheles sinensis]